jgi:hypothetical protein
MTGKEQHLQLPQSLISTKYCCNSRSTSPLARIVLAGHKGQGKNVACAFVTGLHRVTLQWLYSIASKAPPSPSTTYCFSTYPAVNANYHNPPLRRACAPYISSVFAGIYNLDLCLSACCTQPLPGCLLHHHSHLFEPEVTQHQKAVQWPPPPFGGGISVLLNGDLFQLPPPGRCVILQGNLLDGPKS